jgi:t-SNARE complex subunit (syntaxin)
LVERKSKLAQKQKEYKELHAKYSEVVNDYRELAAKYSELMNSKTKAQQEPTNPLQGSKEIVSRRPDAVRIASRESSNVSLTGKKPSVSDSNAIVRKNPLVTFAT